MNPYQPGEDNQDPYEVGYKAGAASRDAEVVSLTNQRDYEYVRAENAEQERDQLRAHINALRNAIEFWMRAEGNYDLMKADKLFQEALATTGDKHGS